MEVWPLKSGWLHGVFNTKMHLDKKPKQFICTANIFNVIFTLFTCVPFSTVIPLYSLHLIIAPSTVEKCKH